VNTPGSAFGEWGALGGGGGHGSLANVAWNALP